MFALRVSDAGSGVTFDMRSTGVSVYLDNFAISQLAADPALGQRFRDALRRRRGDLLFSGLNAIEVSTDDAVRLFLDNLGLHWALLNWESNELRSAEAATPGDPANALDVALAKMFFRQRVADRSDGTVLDISAESIFKLGAFAAWRRSDPTVGRSNVAGMDTALLDGVARARQAVRSKKQLDRHFPSIPFTGHNPVTFLERAVIRDMVWERGFNLKAHDGRDFFHAVAGTALASAVVLDTDWTRRMRRLNLSSRFARIYGPTEVGQLVDALETNL